MEETKQVYFLAYTNDAHKYGRNFRDKIFPIQYFEFLKKLKFMSIDQLGYNIKIVIINLNLLIFPIKLNITYMVKF